MPVSAISRLNYMVKKEKVIRDLKFRDCQNKIDYLHRSGVEYVSNSSISSSNTNNLEDPSKVIQHKIQFNNPNTNVGNNNSEVVNNKVEDVT